MEGFNLPVSKGTAVQLGGIFIMYRNSPLVFNPFTAIFFTKMPFFNREIRFLVVTTLNGP